MSILGIPEKGKSSVPATKKHVVWPYSIQQHNAKRAGKHYDLRLGPQGLSWAIRNWPKPGEKTLAKQTDDHSLSYYGFSGKIPAGYGAGTVKALEHGETEILKSTPDKITFITRDRYLPKRYTLVRTALKDWLLINHTPTTKRREIPQSKPKYKLIAPKDLSRFSDKNSIVMSPKYDGAANVVVLKNNKHPEIFSYRAGKSGLIDHTFKLNYDKLKAKTGSPQPTVVWAETMGYKGKKPLHVSNLSGLLNAGLTNTRYSDTKFKNIAYNISKYKGKDVSTKPYSEKLEILKKIVKDNRFLELPELAKEPSTKKKLIKDILKQKHPQTSEGVILYDLEKSLPLKSKFDKEFIVYIKGLQPGKGKFKSALGGLNFSHTLNGPIVGTIGGGFTEEQRTFFYNNPEAILNKAVLVKAQERLKSGALRAPIFIDFLDAQWPVKP